MIYFTGSAEKQGSILFSSKLINEPNHRDKTRVQMPAKMFPHLKLLCWLFMGPLLVLTQSKETGFLIKFGVFYSKNKILTILFIVKYEKVTL